MQGKLCSTIPGQDERLLGCKGLCRSGPKIHRPHACPPRRSTSRRAASCTSVTPHNTSRSKAVYPSRTTTTHTSTHAKVRLMNTLLQSCGACRGQVYSVLGEISFGAFLCSACGTHSHMLPLFSLRTRGPYIHILSYVLRLTSSCLMNGICTWWRYAVSAKFSCGLEL